ncbi:hypothetical protein KO15_14535, partial [Listeria monocytogenes]
LNVRAVVRGAVSRDHAILVVDRHQLNVRNGLSRRGRAGRRLQGVEAVVEGIEAGLVGGVVQGRHALHDAARNAGLRAVRP